MTPAALEKHEPICELIQQECSKEEAVSILLYSELQIRGSIEDNSEIFFLITQQKHML